LIVERTVGTGAGVEHVDLLPYSAEPAVLIVDGEAVVCDSKGMVSFDHIRYRRHDSSAFL
jgi:ATP-dependent DNA ligase